MIKKNTGTTFGVAAALTLMLAACGDAVGPLPTDVEFAASLGIDLDEMTQSVSGLYIRDDIVGEGVLAAAGDQLTIAYTGWLADGTQFDMSTSFNVPQLGTTGLIVGFTECLTCMQVDGTRTCVLPASLGYASQGQGAIPPDAVTVFEITVGSIVRPPG